MLLSRLKPVIGKSTVSSCHIKFRKELCGIIADRNMNVLSKSEILKKRFL